MKIFKHILFVSFLFLFFLTIQSCSEEEENDIPSSVNTDYNNDVKKDKPKKESLSLIEVHQQLETAKFPQEWDGKKISGNFKTIKVSNEDFEKFKLIEIIYNEDSVRFYWKHKTPEWNLVCLGFNKTGRYMDKYYLATLNNNFELIDELYLAGSEVDNSGISVIEMTQSAVIEKGTGPIETDYEGRKEEYMIDSNGKFIKKDKSIPLADFMNLFKQQSSLPYEADSILISEINNETYNKLKADHISTLFNNGKDIADIYGKGVVEEFISMSMVSNSKAYALHTFDIENGITAYTWAVEKYTDYHSYKKLFISLSENNKITGSYAIAELSSSSDSPMWVEETITANVFNNGDIKIQKKFIEGDSDTGDEFVSKTYYKYSFKNGVLEGGQEKN
ncbi:MAG: hypothetical protein K8R54_06940 [Bacteroidales bacterium]|nr:hypothetical protein [Bacteroidales bacterium]